MQQATALNIMKTGQNVFLTGQAGSGKTFVLNQYIDYLRNHGVEVAVTASTGIAATHLKGMTIHSWSGLGIKDWVNKELLEKMMKKKPLRDRLVATQVLIIDEISMLSSAHLQALDEILRYARVSYEPFGGMQVIISGDFFQLPPVTKDKTLQRKNFAFMAPIWVEAGLKVCYLTEQHRQDDSPLLSLLNAIRAGDLEDAHFDLVNEKLRDSKTNMDLSAPKLFTHNREVESINLKELEAIKDEYVGFRAEISGPEGLSEMLKKTVLAPEILNLKIGAKVMFVRNNYEAGFINGTLGEVVDYHPEDGYPVVCTHEGVEIVAKPESWAVEDEMGRPIAEFKQVPLRLAWAVTVHKSQGMTLDAVEVDLSKTFESGQGYVALSRCKTWDGLRLMGVNQQAFGMDDLVRRADARFQEISADIDRNFSTNDAQSLSTLFEQFIIKSGGELDFEQVGFESPKKLAPKNKVVKGETQKKTLAFLNDGLSILEIATERGLSENTIIGHLEKLKTDGEHLNLESLKPATEIFVPISNVLEALAIDTVHLDEAGRVKLGVAHERLEGKFSYDEIRLVRLFHVQN